MLGQGKSVIFSIQVIDYKWKYVTWLFQFHLHKQPLCDPCYNSILVLSMNYYQEEKIKSRDDLFQILNVTENVEIIDTDTTKKV